METKKTLVSKNVDNVLKIVDYPKFNSQQNGGYLYRLFKDDITLSQCPCMGLGVGNIVYPLV